MSVTIYIPNYVIQDKFPQMKHICIFGVSFSCSSPNKIPILFDVGTLYRCLHKEYSLNLMIVTVELLLLLLFYHLVCPLFSKNGVLTHWFTLQKKSKVGLYSVFTRAKKGRREFKETFHSFCLLYVQHR